MMKLILLTLSFALAQEPTDTPATDDATEQAAEQAALPQYVWTTTDVSLIRWQGSDTTSADVAADTKIQVVLEDGDMVRVRSGTDFGWVSRDTLTTTDPTAP